MISKCLSTALQGKADPINSAFHLTYNMVLNLLRVEQINPEYILERSFFQFQNYSSIPELCDRKLWSSLSNFVINYKTQKVRSDFIEYVYYGE